MTIIEHNIVSQKGLRFLSWLRFTIYHLLFTFTIYRYHLSGLLSGMIGLHAPAPSRSTILEWPLSLLALKYIKKQSLQRAFSAVNGVPCKADMPIFFFFILARMCWGAVGLVKKKLHFFCFVLPIYLYWDIIENWEEKNCSWA